MFIESRNNIVCVSGSLRSNQWHVIRTSACCVYELYPLGIVIDFSGVRWISPAPHETPPLCPDAGSRAQCLRE